MDIATLSSAGVVDLKPKHEHLIWIQWEPENLECEDDIKAILVFDVVTKQKVVLITH